MPEACVLQVSTRFEFTKVVRRASTKAKAMDGWKRSTRSTQASGGAAQRQQWLRDGGLDLGLDLGRVALQQQPKAVRQVRLLAFLDGQEVEPPALQLRLLPRVALHRELRVRPSPVVPLVIEPRLQQGRPYSLSVCLSVSQIQKP